MSTAVRLQTREQRKKLQPRDKPYFADLRRGLSIGYRKGVEGGSWLLREFRGGKYIQRRLGAADDEAQGDGIAVLSWTDAQKVALGSERPTVTRPGKHTVNAAWDAYVATRKNPPDARERATWERFVGPRIGSREASDLTHHELNKWLHDQVTSHGNRGQASDGDEKDRLRRARYTANRRWNLLRAVLNYAFESDAVKSDAAWRKVKPFRNVDRPRTVTASVEQARKLLERLAVPSAVDYLNFTKLLGLAKGALYTGLRLGELLGLRGDDIDVAGSQVRVRHGKGGAERFIPLNREGTAFFADRIKGKAPDTAVLEPMHADARANRVYVARAMKAASEAAGIVPRITFHDLRRSYGSLMLNSGASIESIQQVLGHADTRMTRRTYAHLLQQTVAKSVQKHLPSFTDAAPNQKRLRNGR
jgi:integrase